MRFTFLRCVVLGAAALLAACGGGSTAESSLPPPTAAYVASGNCTQAAIAAGEVQQVQGRCVRSSSLMAKPLAQVAQDAVVPLTPDALFDWAEVHYASLFPAAGKLAGFQWPYTYRVYPQTGNILGVSTEANDVAIYVYGPATAWQITRIATFADYTCTVLPQNCAPPGAPTIQTVTAGNASAQVAFAAPADSGGGAITQYSATCSAQAALSRTNTATHSPITVTSLVNDTLYSCSVTAANSFGTGSPSLVLTVTPSASTQGTTTGTVGTTSTAGVSCGYNYSAYNSSASVRLTSTVSITCNSTQRVLVGNGVPDHATGSFPNANNPNSIAAQSYTFTSTITPSLATSYTAVAHVTGYANNSIPFDPATAETYKNQVNGVTKTWNIEAIQDYMNLGLDTNLAHVQPNGAYHYHGIPAAYLTKLGRGTAMTLVGFALDGFPVYARYGYVDPLDTGSGIKEVASSWRKKTTPDAGRPETSAIPMGTFTQDYEYVAQLGDLDECNGRFGKTPEFPRGIYHYYLTKDFPYIQRCVWGSYADPGHADPPPGPGHTIPASGLRRK